MTNTTTVQVHNINVESASVITLDGNYNIDVNQVYIGMVIWNKNSYIMYAKKEDVKNQAELLYRYSSSYTIDEMMNSLYKASSK